jgi:hypothetical protein
MSVATVRIPVSALRPAAARPLQSAEVSSDAALAALLMQASDTMLNQLIDLLTAQLHQQAAMLSNEQTSAFICLIAQLNERREQAELVANPARRAGLGRASQSFAHKL